jgi:hypothetical protein
MSENWHKRQALMLGSQLPENASDANAVIRELQHLVDTWLHVAPEPEKAPVVTLIRPRPDLRRPVQTGVLLNNAIYRQH